MYGRKLDSKPPLNSCVSAMKSLRRINLNSTKLSALTFEEIKVSARHVSAVFTFQPYPVVCCRLQEELPALQEVDVRYTEAW